MSKAIEVFLDEFKTPTNKFRSAPFWCWNGKLEKNELLRQIDVMKQMGMGGFFMHSRTGLVTEYLSDEWFELINACADYAKEIGMDAYLYDEDRWPSGTAGGLVTDKMEYRAKYMRLSIFEHEITVRENVIAIFAGKCKDLDLISYYIVDLNSPQKKDDELFFVVSIEYMEESNFYNGTAYLDTLNKEAVECFINVTHNKYKEKCGDRLSDSIKGIFTDEAHRGTVMGGFSISNNDASMLLSWTYVLFEEFLKDYGYSLLDCLPELFLKKDEFNKIKYDYIKLLQKLFTNHYVIPYSNWCTENGIKFTGHFLDESSLTSQTEVTGSLMSLYQYMDYPGMDFLTESARTFWIAKQVSSVAEQLGKELVLSELYGCTGWHMSFENYKHISDWQLLQGVNLRCPHLSWYTMSGEAKRDYPASILHQSAWWTKYYYYENYCARISTALSLGDRVADILVLNSVESLWGKIYPGWSEQLTAKDAKIIELEKSYTDLYYKLMGNQLDFDYGDESIMSDHSSVEIIDGKPCIVVGKRKYFTFMFPSAISIRKSTFDLINSFVNVGGIVVFAGEIPQYIESQKSDKVLELSQRCKCLSLYSDDFIPTIKKHSNLPIKINCDSQDLYTHCRVSDNCTILMLLNTNTEEKIELQLSSGYKYTTILDPLTGCQKCFACNADISLEKGQELILMFTNKQIDSNNVENESPNILILEQYKEIPYSLSEDNVCVLDIADATIDDEVICCDEVLKIDRLLRKKFNLDLRGGEMLQPWYVKKFHRDLMDVKCNLKLEFKFYIENIPEVLKLALEDFDSTKVYINETHIFQKSDEYWVDICYSVLPIPIKHLKIGENIITIEMPFHIFSNIESMFLLGDFAVKLKEGIKTLTMLPKALNLGDIKPQGLPFYSGEITYKIPLENEIIRTTKISYNEFKGVTMEIDTGYEKLPVLWSYQDIVFNKAKKLDITLSLSRRNTFGPLHEIPLLSWAYGPDNFITNGDNWTYSYNLIENGLF